MATARKKSPAGAGRTRSTQRRPRKQAAPPEEHALTPQPEPGGSTVVRLARQLKDLTGSLLSITVAATEITITFARQRIASPAQKEMLSRTGDLLRSARNTAGMSIEELGKAIDLKDPVLLDLAENGKAALPFEIILRLTSVLGRKDPVVFFLNLTRSHNPKLWKTIEDLGIGRLLVQAGRERELANIYRACDEARALSDAEYAKMLAFMQAAFDLAMTFRARSAEEAAAG
ncbi:MAG TPA: helix-turn-helix transcriptional regulator [Noviherbaspirillum sp.]